MEGSPGLRASEDHTSAMAHPSALLEVEDLHVSYGGVRALRGVSLTVPERGIVAVLGNNGAGKSTLLRAISGVARRCRAARSTRARSRFDGKALTRHGPGRRRPRRHRAGARGPAHLRAS